MRSSRKWTSLAEVLLEEFEHVASSNVGGVANLSARELDNKWSQVLTASLLAKSPRTMNPWYMPSKTFTCAPAALQDSIFALS